ncbi:MAG: DUF3574 domain-containing protein [Oscillatoriales cyanobacterium RU_3_3]|nr:DUF3574 domain-containing protein [Oscillatoriales cyanobacterium RU_3_3]NJR24270.1 DUF3574 domain-containing protein [Richelia sp. CSU_2_1]
MNKNLHSLVLAGLLFVVPVLPPAVARAGQTAISDANTSQKNFLKDELYFGLSKLNGETVSESEWQEFVKEIITPRFREGLTVLDGSGQFLNSAGILIREKSKIVILIYESSAEKEGAVNEIIETYKRRFQQESVLRTTTEVKVSF